MLLALQHVAILLAFQQLATSASSYPPLHRGSNLNQAGKPERCCTLGGSDCTSVSSLHAIVEEDLTLTA